MNRIMHRVQHDSLKMSDHFNNELNVFINEECIEAGNTAESMYLLYMDDEILIIIIRENCLPKVVYMHAAKQLK